MFNSFPQTDGSTSQVRASVGLPPAVRKSVFKSRTHHHPGVIPGESRCSVGLNRCSLLAHPGVFGVNALLCERALSLVLLGRRPQGERWFSS